jgi:hypothetical protein
MQLWFLRHHYNGIVHYDESVIESDNLLHLRKNVAYFKNMLHLPKSCRLAERAATSPSRVPHLRKSCQIFQELATFSRKLPNLRKDRHFFQKVPRFPTKLLYLAKSCDFNDPDVFLVSFIASAYLTYGITSHCILSGSCNLSNCFS